MSLIELESVKGRSVFLCPDKITYIEAVRDLQSKTTYHVWIVGDTAPVCITAEAFQFLFKEMNKNE